MEAKAVYRIAIVEDEKKEADLLQPLLQRYAEEVGEELEISIYQNAIVFLTNYHPVFDIVFMDIEMPYMNGLESAAKLRETDSSTLLIFATNLGHMAAKGYEVEAFDFIIKPVHYDTLRLKLKRAFTRLAQMADNDVTFSSDGAKIRMPSKEIQYIEVTNHQLVYHTESGNYPVYGTLSRVREQMESLGFALCNNCYLVNLRHVRKVQKFTVTVGDDELQISHPKKKEFLDALNHYIGI